MAPSVVVSCYSGPFRERPFSRPPDFPIFVSLCPDSFILESLTFCLLLLVFGSFVWVFSPRTRHLVVASSAAPSVFLIASLGATVSLYAVYASFVSLCGGTFFICFPARGKFVVAEWLGRLCVGSPSPNLLRHARPCADCGPRAAPGGVTTYCFIS